MLQFHEQEEKQITDLDGGQQLIQIRTAHIKCLLQGIEVNICLISNLNTQHNKNGRTC